MLLPFTLVQINEKSKLIMNADRNKKIALSQKISLTEALDQQH